METRDASNIVQQNISRDTSSCSTYVPCT